LTFDLRGGTLPATTLRKQWIYGIFWELMWFLNGRTDLEYLWDKNIHIWDKNYEKAKNQLQLNENDVGKIYGYQWRKFGGTFDQIKYVTNELKNNPNSRRIMISGWCPPQIFDNACLPPCHVSYNFNVVGKKLYCQILQRSSDVALALSWNIISGALLTHMLANTCNLDATELSITIANAHIYENHIPAVRQMIQRTPRQFPRISFTTKKTDIWDYVYNDFVVYNYDPYPNLYIGEMAV
jgi:thymidylate synthase